MKNLLVPVLILISSSFSFAQQGGGEYVYQSNECISHDDRTSIIAELKSSAATLKKEQNYPETTGGSVSFIWPLQKAAGFTDNGYCGISNYVDHDASSGTEEYNCGTRTYDGHRGTDIYLYPFTWLKMENSSVEIVAAADGTIIYKSDGNDDKTCVWQGAGQWNAVYVKHADGTVAWYGHMKKNTLTSKLVGETVTAGEYLGVVGSSGMSTGPHLHFEVWEDDTYTTLIDPWGGTCNALNGATSKWTAQEDYRVPTINKIGTHSAVPVSPACPGTEIPNEQNSWNGGELIYFISYYRDQESGTSANYAIKNPLGGTWQSWTKNFTNTYNSSWWYWTYNIPSSPVGTWKFEVTYDGTTVEYPFTVGTVTSVAETSENAFKYYPNPANDLLTLEFENRVPVSIELIDVMGKKVLTSSSNLSLKSDLNIADLSAGFYFVKVNFEDSQEVVKVEVK